MRRRGVALGGADTAVEAAWVGRVVRCPLEQEPAHAIVVAGAGAGAGRGRGARARQRAARGSELAWPVPGWRSEPVSRPRRLASDAVGRSTRGAGAVGAVVEVEVMGDPKAHICGSFAGLLSGRTGGRAGRGGATAPAGRSRWGLRLDADASGAGLELAVAPA